MPDLHQIQKIGILVLLLFASFATATAQQDDTERQRAFQLYRDAKYVDALPLFEQLALKYPEDPAVIENLERSQFLFDDYFRIL